MLFIYKLIHFIELQLPYNIITCSATPNFI